MGHLSNVHMDDLITTTKSFKFASKMQKTGAMFEPATHALLVYPQLTELHGNSSNMYK